MIWKPIVILAIVAAIIFGGGYFAYEMYFKPRKLDRQEKEAGPAAIPTPTPDPGLAAFEAIKPVLDQDTPEAREAMAGFLKQFPASPAAPDVRNALGRVNTTLSLSPVPGPDKVSYSVEKGDALMKIAS